MAAADPNPDYWKEYTNLQKVKHDLIRDYLGGWFPKLGFWAGRVVYFDTHAGRGGYQDGHLGSPLVALDTLLNHSYLEELLKKSEFRFVFIERDADNLEELKKELRQRELPNKVHVAAHCNDAFQVLDDIVKNTKGLAPAFIFVDPYGFKVPAATLGAVLKAGRVELFVNVIWRELDMAIAQGRQGTACEGMLVTLNEIFGGEEWKKEITSEDIDERADQAAQLLARKVGAKWHTYIRMLGDNGRTRYMLLHLTNHDDGRDLMKDCIWKAAPDGGYYVRKSVDPGQQLLIEPEPNLEPLHEWIMEKLASGPMRWKDLQVELRPELWREVQLNRMIRDLKKAGKIKASDYTPPFFPKANPLLTLA